MRLYEWWANNGLSQSNWHIPLQIVDNCCDCSESWTLHFSMQTNNTNNTNNQLWFYYITGEAVCSYNHLTWNDKCVKEFTSKKSWDDSRSRCASDGGRLIEFDSIGQIYTASDISHYLQSYSLSAIWVGARKQKSWYWSDDGTTNSGKINIFCINLCFILKLTYIGWCRHIFGFMTRTIAYEIMKFQTFCSF